MRRAHVFAVAAALVLGGTAVAVASIPDAQGVIHGCRNTKTGALRAIDTDVGQTCGKDEAALNWNQTGPQGPAGPPGTVSPTTETRTVHYVPDPPTSGTTGASETVTCPSGMHAVNGGILQTQADPTWPGTSGSQGGAFVGLEQSGNEPSADNPAVAYGASRPVDSGTGWRVTAYIVHAYADPGGGGDYIRYPVDVTFYAICV
jgi:hypothetical protein